jgi:hypothetical protein
MFASALHGGRVSEQLTLFEKLPREPEGLRYAADFVSTAIEQKLILGIRTLPLQPFQFGQFVGKRRVASFGFRYDYDLHQLQRAEPMPGWLAVTVEKIETFGGPSRFGRFFAPNTTSASASAGTATSPISIGYLAFLSHPPANSDSADPPASHGSASRSMLNLARST